MNEATLPDTEEVLSGTEDETAIVAPEDASQEITQADNDEAPAQEPVVEEKKEKVTGFQKRVQRFERQLSEKEQELEYWRSIALKAQGGTAAQPEAPAKPKLEDFGSVEDYIEAREQFLRQEILEQVTNVATKTSEQSKVLASYEAKVEAARASTADWDEVLEAAGDEPTAPETVRFCLESDVGPLIAYTLAKDPDLNERINSLPPHRRFAELGKLEDRLTRPAAPKATTKAPTKLPEVRGSATTVAKTSGEASSYAEWKALQAKAKR